MGKVSKFIVGLSVVTLGSAALMGGGIAATNYWDYANKRDENKDEIRYSDTDGLFEKTTVQIDKRHSDILVSRTDCPHFEGERCSYFDQSGDGTLDNFVIEGYSGISGAYVKDDFFDYPALHFNASQDYHQQLQRFRIYVPLDRE